MSFFPKLTAKLTPFSKNCSICPKIYTIWNVNFTKKWHFCPKYHRMKWYTIVSKSQHFSQDFNYFCPKLTFCTKIDVEKNTRHFTPKFARHDFITVLKNSLIYPKTNTFCIKWYFLPKGNNTTWNWHFSKTGKTSLRKLNISTRN